MPNSISYRASILRLYFSNFLRVSFRQKAPEILQNISHQRSISRQTGISWASACCKGNCYFSSPAVVSRRKVTMPDNETRPKRSRFDQTTPARPSRFDQRSRSPPLSREKPTRERDSSDRGASSEPAPAKAPVSDPAAAAGSYTHPSLFACLLFKGVCFMTDSIALAAAAARINAQIHSRRSDMTSVASVRSWVSWNTCLTFISRHKVTQLIHRLSQLQ